LHQLNGVKYQVALSLVSIVVVVLLFFFGRTTPNSEPSTNGLNAAGVFEIDGYIKSSKDRLMIIPKDSLALLESLMAGRKSDSLKLSYLDQIIKIWENSGNFAVASEYYRKSAQIDSTAENWEKAGDMLFEAFKINRDTTVGNYLISKSMEAYQTASAIDTSSNDLNIKLAETYIDGTNNVMAGVTLLLDVVKKDPENGKANLILGRLAVVSGQYDRAIDRLTKLLKREPENVEAMFYLAGAYEKTGKVNLATEYFRRCQKLVKNPAIKQQIEMYLKNLK